MKRRLLSLLAVFCMAFSTVGNVHAAEQKLPQGATEEQILGIASELEYIFTNIIIQDVSGEYFINEEEINNSSYTSEEKAGMIAFTQYMNELNSSGDLMTTNNTVKRCLGDALGIGGQLLDQFVRYVDAGDWVGAAGVLGAANILVSPLSIFIFALTCGAGSAS